MIRRTRTTRRGFTLVELLVSTALTILVMTVIATAFQVALKVYSDAKSVSGLAAQLRVAETVMGRDLEADHLWDDDAGHAVRVSDASHPQYKVPGYGAWTAPHQHGFFHVEQLVLPMQSYKTATVAGDHSYTAPTTPPYAYLDEGQENGKRSYRATTHRLDFTVRLAGTSPDKVAFGRAPNPAVQSTPQGANELVASAMNLKDMDPTGSQFVSQWAEVSYFLTPTAFGTEIDGQPAGTAQLPLFTLRRRQWVLTPQPFPLVHNPSNNAPDNNPSPQLLDPTAPTVNLQVLYPELSATLQTTPPLTYQKWFTNTPSTAKNPGNRGGGTGNPYAATTDGSDVVLSNVVSMHVRVQSEAPVFRPKPFVLPAPNGTFPWYPTTYAQPSEFHDLGLSLEDPFYTLPIQPPTYPAIFDTTSTQFNYTHSGAPNTAPHPPIPANQQHIRQLRAIEIVLRIYDFKTHHTRQVTIRRDL